MNVETKTLAQTGNPTAGGRQIETASTAIQKFETATNPADIVAAMQQRANEFKALPKPGRIIGAIAPGDPAVWQGDVSVTCISDDEAKGMTLKPLKCEGSHAQVAVGTGVGARHLVSLTECEVFTHKGQEEDPLMGPVVVAPKGFRLSHPEHEHCVFPPGTYRIGYQRMFDVERKRAAD